MQNIKNVVYINAAVFSGSNSERMITYRNIVFVVAVDMSGIGMCFNIFIEVSCWQYNVSFSPMSSAYILFQVQHLVVICMQKYRHAIKLTVRITCDRLSIFMDGYR